MKRTRQFHPRFSFNIDQVESIRAGPSPRPLDNMSKRWIARNVMKKKDWIGVDQLPSAALISRFFLLLG